MKESAHKRQLTTQVQRPCARDAPIATVTLPPGSLQCRVRPHGERFTHIGSNDQPFRIGRPLCFQRDTPETLFHLMKARLAIRQPSLPFEDLPLPTQRDDMECL